MRLTRRHLAALGGLAMLPAQPARPARAQTQPLPPPGEPVLRIETGAHVARTQELAKDAAGRLLLSASDDKTGRLWSLPDLRPLGVLRPPVGPGFAGSLYAAALSPDGRLAALAGWLGEHADGGVLLFDTTSLQVVRRLPLPRLAVNVLAFSADGTRLAAGCSGNGGPRLWRVADGTPLPGDSDYQAEIYGLDFAPDGRLAVASYDGAVRLYDPSGRRTLRRATEAARRPFRIRFSPDGSLLALGFGDAIALEVCDGATLALRNRPNVAGLGGNALGRVGWSADGASLLAGDDPWEEDGRPVYAWAAQGGGARRLAARGFGDGPSTIHGLPGGGLVFASKSGEIALVDPAGQRRAERPRGAGDTVNSGSLEHPANRLKLTRDGAAVEWVFYSQANRWLRFDAARLELRVGQPPSAEMTDWKASLPGLAVTEWQNQNHPKVNGRPLPLVNYETARSVAVAPGRVLLGTSWHLRLFDAEARQQWTIDAPGAGWRANLSPDGRLAVAAFADGSIRWYRLSDGAELLALFVTPSADRWVAWTPTGYYACAAGAEDLIGWNLNRGEEHAADFFPGSRFRDRFYRPDVVKLVLATLDEGAALTQANASRRQPTRDLAVTADLPALASILSPAEDAQLDGPVATISVSLRSPSGAEIRQVVPLLDGSPAAGFSPLEPQPTPPEATARGERYFRFTLPVPPGRTSLLALRADTATREGVVATRRLRGAQAAPAAPAAPTAGPRLNALLIGVSDYANPDYRQGVGFAAKDAADLAALLREQADRSLFNGRVKVTTLTNAQATREAVLDALAALRSSAGADDVTVISFAGHGVLDDGATHFLPQNGDVNRLDSTSIDPSQLGRIIAGLRGKVLVLFDICHAGNALFAAQRGPDVNGLLNQMRKPGSGVMVLAATPAQDTAIEVPGGQNGAFTDAVLRALRDGAPANRDGLVYTDQLTAFTKQWMRDTYGRAAIGYPLDPNVTDFPLLARR